MKILKMKIQKNKKGNDMENLFLTEIQLVEVMCHEPAQEVLFFYAHGVMKVIVACYVKLPCQLHHSICTH